MVSVQYDKLEKERMAGIVPSGQVTGFFYRFTKGPFYKISYEFRIETADLFSGELGFIPATAILSEKHFPYSKCAP